MVYKAQRILRFRENTQKRVCDHGGSKQKNVLWFGKGDADCINLEVTIQNDPYFMDLNK